MQRSHTKGEGTRVKINIWVKPLLLIVIVCGLTFVAYNSGLFHFFISKEKILKFLDSLGPAAFIGFILLQVVQVVVAPIPGEVTGLLGGFLYGPLLGVLLSTIGLTIGSYVDFVMARSLGRPFVEKVVSKVIMRRFDYLLHHKGAFLVFLLFLIPGSPKDYLCYILGLGHLSTSEFLLIGGVGRLFGTILLTIGGTYIRYGQYASFFTLTGIAIVVVLIAMVFRGKLERLFRILHIRSYKRQKAKRGGRITSQ
ncbi:MAG: TVP38/TMEM64 family protein [Dissulfurispiraceae bacterium]